MSSCDLTQAAFTAFLDGDLDAAASAELASHLAGCETCAELLSILQMNSGDAATMAEVRPPSHLAGELQSSPCRRWLGLLFSAIDHDIGDENLKRLLIHLEDCESCQQAWDDMTLIHQIGETMTPPQGLARACATVHRRRTARPRVLGRRAATAAAYVLAVFASLVIGNPVTLARNPAAVAVQRVADTVSTGVSTAAEDGRGEMRVMLWRAWTWTTRQSANIRAAFESSDQDTDSVPEQGGTS